VEKVHRKAGVNALRSLENVNEAYLPSSVIKEELII